MTTSLHDETLRWENNGGCLLYFGVWPGVELLYRVQPLLLSKRLRRRKTTGRQKRVEVECLVLLLSPSGLVRSVFRVPR